MIKSSHKNGRGGRVGLKAEVFRKESYIRHEDFFRPPPSPSVTLRVPPLISEMGWTGELWSKTKFLILEN